MNDAIEKFIAVVRNSSPFMPVLFRYGQCYNFHLILREVFPDAQAFYSESEGHVYTKINDRFYDINGKHLKVPSDLQVLNCRDGDPPHRWGSRRGR